MIIVTRVDWTIGPDDWQVENYMGVLGMFESYDEAKDAIQKDLDSNFDPKKTMIFDGGEGYCDPFDHVGLKFKFKNTDAPEEDRVYSRREGILMSVDYYCTEM